MQRVMSILAVEYWKMRKHVQLYLALVLLDKESRFRFALILRIM